MVDETRNHCNPHDKTNSIHRHAFPLPFPACLDNVQLPLVVINQRQVPGGFCFVDATRLETSGLPNRTCTVSSNKPISAQKTILPFNTSTLHGINRRISACGCQRYRKRRKNSGRRMEYEWTQKRSSKAHHEDSQKGRQGSRTTQ